jgi:hypothetical protein
MELILAVVAAGPIGYFTEARKRALVTYLALWAIVFPVQSVVVFSPVATVTTPSTGSSTR